MKLEIEIDGKNEELFRKALKFENSKYEAFLIDPFALAEILFLKGLNDYIKGIELINK